MRQGWREGGQKLLRVILKEKNYKTKLLFSVNISIFKSLSICKSSENSKNFHKRLKDFTLLVAKTNLV
ncbi:CLUMA_CG005898, isoform A [Clunio marinus]|uniref:CLUMA_CG005898, isoform A n=1 Tax=Clunio marinus TaxID=568069 RepID=A0A1J1HWE7_9DIPT|nr:CLUMA_CG005898, isoform A [Clunio marinus]